DGEVAGARVAEPLELGGEAAHLALVGMRPRGQQLDARRLAQAAGDAAVAGVADPGDEAGDDELERHRPSISYCATATIWQRTSRAWNQLPWLLIWSSPVRTLA